jgi:hypothetical protein
VIPAAGPARGTASARSAIPQRNVRADTHAWALDHSDPTAAAGRSTGDHERDGAQVGQRTLIVRWNGTTWK